MAKVIWEMGSDTVEKYISIYDLLVAEKLKNGYLKRIILKVTQILKETIENRGKRLVGVLNTYDIQAKKGRVSVIPRTGNCDIALTST